MDEDVSLYFGEDEFIRLESVVALEHGLKMFHIRDPTSVIDPSIYHATEEAPFVISVSIVKQQILAARKMRDEIVKLRDEVAALKKMMETLANPL